MSRGRTLAALLFVLTLGVPQWAAAVPIALGGIAFDTFLPGPGGTNAFFLFNFTGDPATGGFALPPDFPVINAVTFGSPLLTWDAATAGSFDFGHAGIGPGSLDPDPQIQFPDTLPLFSATFTALLSTDLLRLSDGRLFRATSLTLTAMLTNPNAVLAPGDFAILSVEADEVPSSVPEPASLALVATGLAVYGWRRHKKVLAKPASSR